MPMAMGKPDTWDPAASYLIKLNRTVRLGGGFLMRPTHQKIVVKGGLAEAIADAIDSAEKII